MIFCGQCGLQLAPGTQRCPRCGATVDEAGNQIKDVPMYPDDATIASRPLPSPQPLILRDGGDYGSPMAYDATKRVDSNYGMQRPVTPNTQMSTYGNTYANQSGSGYPSQANYGDYGIRGAGTYGGHPMQSQQGYPQQYVPEQPAPTNKVRITALVVVLLGVLLVLLAIVLFVLQHTNVIADTPTTTPVRTTITVSTTSQTLSDTWFSTYQS